MRRGDGARTPAAAYSLAMRYSTGEGMPQDHREAARLFRIAADQGHARAQHELACRYDEGEGVPQNHSEAARYYRLAADQGHADAQNNIAVCYARGEGVPQNDSEAARYYRLAADQGHAMAQCNTAIYLAKGEGVPQDLSEAARYYRLAADQGHDMAQCHTAICYVKGEGVPQDLGEAARFYRLAADQQYPPAQLGLGVMLIGVVAVDERVPTDPRAGAKLLAQVVQCEGAEYEQLRLQALELLRQHADQREVVAACCIGCGASRGLKTCDRCHVARFCSAACMRQMWPTHKRCCKEWAQQGEAPQ
jgi:TPR repeat protein